MTENKLTHIDLARLIYSSHGPFSYFQLQVHLDNVYAPDQALRIVKNEMRSNLCHNCSAFLWAQCPFSSKGEKDNEKIKVVRSLRRTTLSTEIPIPMHDAPLRIRANFTVFNCVRMAKKCQIMECSY